MSQSDILKFLKRKYKQGIKKYYPSRAISKALGVNCFQSLKKLRKHNFVRFKKEFMTSGKYKGYIYYVYKHKA